jgi:hypothetical protein
VVLEGLAIIVGYLASRGLKPCIRHPLRTLDVFEDELRRLLADEWNKCDR